MNVILNLLKVDVLYNPFMDDYASSEIGSFVQSTFG